MKTKLISAGILFALVLGGAYALDGQIVSVSGKVEAQNLNGAWIPLKAGDTLIAGTMISTGFKSEATVKLGASVLTIKPLTRMTLTQLLEKEDTVDTELYLEVGNVKAEVNSLNNKKNGFTVRSPVATASVRGTVFEMGEELVILQGAVVFTSPVGQKRTGSAGQELKITNDSVSSPVAALQNQMETIILSSTPSTEVKSAILATSITAKMTSTPAVSASTPVLLPTNATLALTID